IVLRVTVLIFVDLFLHKLSPYAVRIYYVCLFYTILMTTSYLTIAFNIGIYVGYSISITFFFFQAEDGIRDRNVTGVQTCALPISDGEAPGRRHDLAREEPADDRERFLERRRARRQARAHRGELALVVAEAALEDEASPRERRQRPHLLRHEDRIPERQEEEAAGGPVSPLG